MSLEARPNHQLATIHRLEEYRTRKKDITWFTGPETSAQKRKRQITKFLDLAGIRLLILSGYVSSAFSYVFWPKEEKFEDKIIPIEDLRTKASGTSDKRP